MNIEQRASDLLPWLECSGNQEKLVNLAAHSIQQLNQLVSSHEIDQLVVVGKSRRLFEVLYQLGSRYWQVSNRLGDLFLGRVRLSDAENRHLYGEPTDHEMRQGQDIRQVQIPSPLCEQQLDSQKPRVLICDDII